VDPPTKICNFAAFSLAGVFVSQLPLCRAKPIGSSAVGSMPIKL
jgi:hypothetical protein